MPALRNQRREQFAQERAKGATVKRAYQVAGYSVDRGNAARLAKTPEVAARVTELLEESASKIGAHTPDTLASQQRLNDLRAQLGRAFRVVGNAKAG